MARKNARQPRRRNPSVGASAERIRSPFEGRDGGMASVCWALEERTVLRHITRADLAGRSYREVRERWIASKWVDARAVTKATGRRKSTVYYDLARMKREEQVQTREVTRRDRRGIPRKVIEYQLPQEPVRIDPDATHTWIEISGRRYPMVDEWKCGSSFAISGWTTLTTSKAFRNALVNAKNLIVFFWLSRESCRRGKKSLSELYRGVQDVGGDLLRDVDAVLDRAERGGAITLRTRGVMSGEHPEAFAFSGRIKLDPAELAASQFAGAFRANENDRLRAPSCGRSSTRRFCDALFRGLSRRKRELGTTPKAMPSLSGR